MFLKESILIITNWILEIYLMLANAKTAYELELANLQKNLNNAFEKTSLIFANIWRNHSRRRKRAFARREERKRGVLFYEIDKAQWKRRKEVRE